MLLKRKVASTYLGIESFAPTYVPETYVTLKYMNPLQLLQDHQCPQPQVKYDDISKEKIISFYW